MWMEEEYLEQSKFVTTFCLWIWGRTIHLFKIIIINVPINGFTSSNPLSILLGQFFPSFETFFKVIQVNNNSRSIIVIVVVTIAVTAASRSRERGRRMHILSL